MMTLAIVASDRIEQPHTRPWQLGGSRRVARRWNARHLARAIPPPQGRGDHGTGEDVNENAEVMGRAYYLEQLATRPAAAKEHADLRPGDWLIERYLAHRRSA